MNSVYTAQFLGFMFKLWTLCTLHNSWVSCVKYELSVHCTIPGFHVLIMNSFQIPRYFIDSRYLSNFLDNIIDCWILYRLLDTCIDSEYLSRLLNTLLVRKYFPLFLDTCPYSWYFYRFIDYFKDLWIIF